MSPEAYSLYSAAPAIVTIELSDLKNSFVSGVHNFSPKSSDYEHLGRVVNVPVTLLVFLPWCNEHCDTIVNFNLVTRHRIELGQPSMSSLNEHNYHAGFLARRQLTYGPHLDPLLLHGASQKGVETGRVFITVGSTQLKRQGAVDEFITFRRLG
ncbi:hypothetical protein EJ05DRAFT_490861 [Pseudovirgaria hyperparasitica]|uniref:Uncharacterized protein n=1 Tax=Pseudovirgaria hyperparasitica TaxID=470096 RepID=A0A6A6VRF9_9PEZI|nr:uncharacterized protein EJ05DRAFT_490861 [Pseudovirgaria hyperparasitica]KAF2752489.1 hypothetical protein EJ05DRAFT_490861 [Pseudovirgaria hyperparasitica]